MNGCTVCHSPSVDAVDAALRGGLSQSKAAKQYGLGRMALSRHFRAHLVPMAPRSAPRTVPRPGDPISGLPVDSGGPAQTAGGAPVDPGTLRDRLLVQLAKIEARLDEPGMATGAYLLVLTQMRLVVAELAKMPAPSVEALDPSRSPDWVALWAVVLEVMDRYPGVAEALRLAIEEHLAGAPVENPPVWAEDRPLNPDGTIDWREAELGAGGVR